MGPTDGMLRSLKSSADHSRTIADAGRRDPSERSATQRHYILVASMPESLLHARPEANLLRMIAFGSVRICSLPFDPQVRPPLSPQRGLPLGRFQ
jgi:hypothetical protein